MRLPEVLALYLIVGIGIALVWIYRSSLKARDRAMDATILLLFWPLYAPFLLLGDSRAPAGSGGDVARELCDALERVRGSALSPLLPDRESVERLAVRIREAQGRMREIEALLERPDLSDSATEQRATALEAQGGTGAAALVRNRARCVRRLREQRERIGRQLDEVREILVQLRLQAEMVRIAEADQMEGGGLLPELQARLKSLDEILGDRLT